MSDNEHHDSTEIDGDSSWMARLRRRSRRLLVSPYGALLVGVFVLGGTLLSWRWLEEHQRKVVQADCDRYTRDYVHALGKRTARMMITVRALEAYWAGSVQVTDEEFEAFSAPFLRDGGSIHALQWISRVRGERREAFTDTARERVRSDYDILEFDRDGELTEAPRRGEHFAVTYLQSSSTSEIAHGFDWSSVDSVEYALRGARDRAEPVMSAPYDLPGQTVDHPRVVIFSPIYDAPRPPASLNDRRRLLEGFVAVTADLPLLFEEALEGRQDAGVEFYIADATHSPTHLLHPELEELEAGPDALADERVDTRRARSFVVEESIEFAGREWMLIGAPTDSFLSERLTNGPNTLLGSGLALTAVVVAAFLTLVGRTRSTDRLVDERTAELERANEELTAKTEALEQSHQDLWEAKTLAEQASQAKGKFLAHMSHELRTPLNAVIGFSKLMSQTELDEQQREYLITIEESADGLLRVVEQLLDLSRFDRGEGELERRRFELCGLIDEICALHRKRARRENLDFECVYGDDLPGEVIGDRGRLRQVIDNIVGNAIKFTHRGSVEVRARLEEQSEERATILFEVSDTGIGIPDDQKDQLFDAFSRVEDPLSRQFGGIGLGLTVAHKLVEQMNGRIWFDSQLGEGSRFCFTVELQLPGGDQSPQTDAADSSRPLDVLVVEDSPVNRKLVLRLLEKKGHDIDVAVDGQEALDLFEPGKYDVVLMDVQLPRLSGLEATECIRRRERDGDKTPVIALTAHARGQEREALFKAGVDHHLPKPLKPKKLYEVLRRVARGGFDSGS